MSIIGFIAIFVVLKFIITWIAIFSLVMLISPNTAWKMRVLWGKLQNNHHMMTDPPASWRQRVRIGSLIMLPICLTLLALFARALLPVLT